MNLCFFYFKKSHYCISSFNADDKKGDCLSAPILIDQELQPEMQEITLELEIIGEGVFPCICLSGFAGLSKSQTNVSIKAEIGWLRVILV